MNFMEMPRLNVEFTYKRGNFMKFNNNSNKTAYTRKIHESLLFL